MIKMDKLKNIVEILEDINDDVLEVLTSVLENKAPTKWFSVEDSMPTTSGDYLLVCNGNVILEEVDINNIQSWFRKNTCVTHWMKIPKPPML